MRNTLNLSREELKQKLKEFKSRGLTGIKLSASFDSLEKEYARIMGSLDEEVIDYLGDKKRRELLVKSQHKDYPNFLWIHFE
jgi:hypothetical protein